MVHYLKLLSIYALPKICGDKPFEIRLNDRKFNVGDKVVYSCPDNRYYDFILSRRTYVIRYICDYHQFDNYIVFSDEVFKND